MRQQLTILQLLPMLEEGGVERGTVELGKYLTSQGHQSLVVSGGGRLVETLVKQGSKHFELPIGRKSLFTFRFVKQLRKIIIDNAVDIVHVRSRFPGWVNFFAVRGIPVAERPKIVATVHGAYSTNSYSKIMLKADSIIAISDYIQSYILENYPDTSPDKISIIHRGVDTKKYYPTYEPSAEWKEAWYAENPSTQNKPLLCLPGRITRLKGQHDFIHLCERIKTMGQPFHGIIVGGYAPNKKSYYDELTMAVQQTRLSSEVSFIGSRNDLINILAISDIVYSFSKQPEAFGRTSLEALALGKPVIAYDHGGCKEILGSMFPEGLVKLNDIELAVSKTLGLIKSKSVVTQNHSYTLQNMLEKTLAVYLKTLQQH